MNGLSSAPATSSGMRWALTRIPSRRALKDPKPDNTRPRRMLDISSLCEWDPDAGFHLIPATSLDSLKLPSLMTKRLPFLIAGWGRGQLALSAPEEVPLSLRRRRSGCPDAGRRPVLPRDAWAHLRQCFFILGNWSTGCRAPGCQMVLVDGNNRWATAWIRGEDSFQAKYSDWIRQTEGLGIVPVR